MHYTKGWNDIPSGTGIPQCTTKLETDNGAFIDKLIQD
jgi:hypothetical protein